MAKVSEEILRAVEDAFERYRREIEASPLALNTKYGYLLQASKFVRWLDDDFEPRAYRRRPR